MLRCIYELNFIKICAAFWEKSKMCFTKIVNQNRKYKSQRSNLNKLKTTHPENSPNQIWTISGQWFYRRRSFKNCTKVYHFLKIAQKYTIFSMKNMGSTPILPNLVGVHPRNIHTTFEANPCRGSREVNNGILHSDI